MKNLLIATVGSSSCWQSWFDSTENQNFDFIALCYEDIDNTILNHAKIALRVTGQKYQLIYDFLNQNNLIASYDTIFIPDDDISMSTSNINKLFSIFAQYKLQLAQPCLDNSSYYSHKITKWCKKPRIVLRYTNFVEIMCPIFSSSALLKCLATFNASPNGYGLDFVWAQLLNFNHMAIIDRVQVNHSRPVNSPKILKSLGINPKKLIRTVVSKFDAKIYRLKVSGYESDN